MEKIYIFSNRLTNISISGIIPLYIGGGDRCFVDKLFLAC